MGSNEEVVNQLADGMGRRKVFRKAGTIPFLAQGLR